MHKPLTAISLLEPKDDCRDRVLMSARTLDFISSISYASEIFVGPLWVSALPLGYELLLSQLWCFSIRQNSNSCYPGKSTNLAGSHHIATLLLGIITKHFGTADKHPDWLVKTWS